MRDTCAQASRTPPVPCVPQLTASPQPAIDPSIVGVGFRPMVDSSALLRPVSCGNSGREPGNREPGSQDIARGSTPRRTSSMLGSRASTFGLAVSLVSLGAAACSGAVLGDTRGSAAPASAPSSLEAGLIPASAQPNG